MGKVVDLQESVVRLNEADALLEYLAGILSLQERIGAECEKRWSNLPAVQAAAI